METSPLICRANQWTGFYMISASVMKGLIYSLIYFRITEYSSVLDYIGKRCLLKLWGRGQVNHLNFINSV